MSNDCAEYIRRFFECEFKCECRILAKEIKKGKLKKCCYILKFLECEIKVMLVGYPYFFVFSEFTIFSVKNNDGYGDFPVCKYCKCKFDQAYMNVRLFDYNFDHKDSCLKSWLVPNKIQIDRQRHHDALFNKIQKSMKIKFFVHVKLCQMHLNNVVYHAYKGEFTMTGRMLMKSCKDKVGMFGLLPKDIAKIIIKQYSNDMQLWLIKKDII